MLEELSVANYALIEEINIRFDKGFNILTGETGAGKSILVGALGLLFGSRGDVTYIRTGASEAVISGVINVQSNEEVSTWLEEHGINAEDGVVIVKRVIKKNGRGSTFIQGHPSTRNDLTALTSLIFDMHGQHEHQSLLKIENHRKLVDRYGGHEDLVSVLYSGFIELAGLKKEYEDLHGSEAEKLREKDILLFSIREIEEAALRPEEEEELESEVLLLSQAEKLFSLLESFNASVSEGRGGALSGLRAAKNFLEGIAGINPEFAPLVKRFDDAFFEAEDIAETLGGYKDSVDFSPEKLDHCEQRLQHIHRLEKKYGNTISDVQEYAEECRKKAGMLEAGDAEIEALKGRINELEKKVLSNARELSEKRKGTAAELEKKIEEQLYQLGMPKAKFKVETGYRGSENGKSVCGPYGFDRIEFLISPNEGEPVKKLKDIASGGEISRVMLAIKSVLTKIDHIQSFIFDEIDSGIGGVVAVSVGEHLKKISEYKQILCITHLAQVAVCADNHIVVEKGVVQGRTVTGLTTIRDDEKKREIARMLSGDSDGEASLVHAEEMLKKYKSAD